ncbi:MAG: hypothetical protein ACUVUA_18370 [Chloroflexus sp.]|uniref:hypothetical protein n=1 Tax=Chloroflexus sp. TaxID=1904827 RepID=UPI00404A9585
MTSTLSFSIDIPPDESETLRLALQSAGCNVQTSARRDFDWQTLVVVVRDIGEIAGSVAATVAALEKIADKINEYREKQRQQGKPPQGTLRRPGQPPLDLATATDQQVLQWLLNNPPQP